MQGSIDYGNIQHRLKRLEDHIKILETFHEKYDSGWLLNELGGVGVADWTNVHLGNDPTDPTDNLTHGLDTPLPGLIVNIFLSTIGTDATSFSVLYYSDGGGPRGITLYSIDNNTIKIQTAGSGLGRLSDAAGTVLPITTHLWYYKIMIGRL